jgi:hypothetical protein
MISQYFIHADCFELSPLFSRSFMTKVLFSPRVDHGPRGTSQNVNKLSHIMVSVMRGSGSSCLCRKGRKIMKLQINVPVSGLDLAGLLQGEEGLFLCQNRGQDYITVAKPSRSIAFGPTPIGPGHYRTAVSQSRAGALVRHQDKQLDRVCRIPDTRASRQQIKCAEAKSKSAKSKASVGFAHRGFLFLSRNVPVDAAWRGRS